ncbi:MAG: HAD hydrolase-like protein [Roseburia sp.]|nr:HAD hydrolase-like protein [Roseburia sp.]
MDDKKISFEEAGIIFAEYKKELEADWVLFDDVVTCLEKLKETEKGIASNGEMSQQQNKLQVTKIDGYFIVKKYASEMKTAKPAYDFFEQCKKYSSNHSYIYVGMI